MIVVYTHREEELNVRGQMLVDVRITGGIIYEKGDEMGPDGWDHHGCAVVEMRMHDGFKIVQGEAAEIIYRAFCEMWKAEELAAIYEKEAA